MRLPTRNEILLGLGAIAFGSVISAAQIGPIRPSGGGGTTIPSSARVPFLASCPTGWTQDATLDGTMLLATTAAHGDVGGTGGANLITPTGTNSTPTFTGNAVTSTAVSAGTPAGSVSQPTLTMNAYTPAGTNATVSFTPAGTNGSVSFTPSGTVTAPTISWPAGVPTSNALTFTGTASTAIVNHTHPSTLVMQGGTTAATTGTHIMNSTATGGSVRAITSGDAISTPNPSGGVASYTPAGTINTPTLSWPAGVPTNSTPTFTGSSGTVGAQTFTGSSGTVPAEAFTGTPATLTGSVSQPTFTGSALGTHQHSTTATGSVSTPSFTGDQFDNRSAYTKVIWCHTANVEPGAVATSQNAFPLLGFLMVMAVVMLIAVKQRDA